MKRLLPQSLFGQTLLVLGAGLIVSLLVGSWIYTLDREQAVRAVGGLAAAQRMTNLTRLVEDTPREGRERIVAGLSDQTFRVLLSSQPPAIAPNDDDVAVAQAIKEFLVDQLSLTLGREPRVAASLPDRSVLGGRGPMMGPGPMMHGFGGFGGFGNFRELQVAVPLANGQWLSFATALPESGSSFSRQFFLSMAIMAIVIFGASLWAVRRVTAPLAAVSIAAERLGNDLNASPMLETGSVETRQAARAFNTMQARLRGLIESRTSMLAAISHDLRTPLTLLRLRLENVENQQDRDKMLATIAEMDSMIGATLQFARDEATTELRRSTDLAALVQSTVDDMADAGMPVKMLASEPIVSECPPEALKRVVRNLLDNAVKYGKAASVSVRATPETIEITIEDEGPGIPEQYLTRVFDPFYRLEESRSRETGGAGLGLAIAQSIVQAQRGTLILSNKASGGLCARIELPR